MKRKMRWIPAVLAAAVLMCACSRRDDLPSEAETEDRTTQSVTSGRDDESGIMSDAEDLVSDAVDNGEDMVSDVIDGGQDIASDIITEGSDLLDGSDTSETQETR